MLIVFFCWLLIFCVFYITGKFVLNLTNSINKRPAEQSPDSGFDECFFTGFLTISLLTSILSIFISVDTKVLIGICLLVLFILIKKFHVLHAAFEKDILRIKSLQTLNLGIFAFLILFLLTFIVHPITLGDTESYHAQTIQWIRKYAVVPGLGNIHGRLAFNSMFFIISGLFTFRIGDVLIFPVIGISFVVAGLKLLLLYDREVRSGEIWRGIFYLSLIFFSMLMLIYDLNSTSPDIICTILIVYVFIKLMEVPNREKMNSFKKFILISLVVFSCVTYKLSSALLVTSLLLFMQGDFRRRMTLAFLIGLIIITPFLIRNYYLSGYLVYPLPQIDIFNPDWKIPLNDVVQMKSEIEGFAKMPGLPHEEVVRMKITDWIIPWFRSLTGLQKDLLIINLFSVITFLLMLFKKEFRLAAMQVIIYINLFFWLMMAPDPRFAYGFIISGAAMTIAFIVRVVEFSKIRILLKFHQAVLAILFFVFSYHRADYPKNVLLQPSRWIIPAPFGTVETRTYYSNFEYRVPVPEGGCFNVEIPCVPFPLENVVLRGDKIKDGFRTE
ncbi:MAG: LIC_10190 family membrane protein [Methanococcaceae archaeon]